MNLENKLMMTTNMATKFDTIDQSQRNRAKYKLNRKRNGDMRKFTATLLLNHIPFQQFDIVYLD